MEKGFYGKLAKIAIPISIQGIVSSTLGMIDTLMVGTLGEDQLAAVGISLQIFFINYLILYGFTSGSATFMAQFYGTRDTLNIKRVLGFAVTVAFCIATVFAIVGFFFTEEFLSIYSNNPKIVALAVPYVKIGSITFFTLAISAPLESAFRSIQQTKIPLIISSVVFSTNTILNYILIFGKLGFRPMGIIGAVTATVIARILEATISLAYLFGKNSMLKGGIKDYMSWNRELAKRIIKNNLPTSANEFLWSIGQTMYVAAFSRIGTTAYAAYQVAASINHIFHFAAFSIGDATLILVGEKLGQGKGDEAYALGKKLLKIGIVFGIIFGLLLILSAKPILSLFSLSSLGRKFAFYIIIVFGTTMFLSLYNGMQVTGTLRAGGDTTFAMIVEIGCVWLVAVPIAFATSLWLGLPIYLAVLAIKSEELVKSIFVTKRFLSKKWVKVMIEGL